VGVKVLSDEGMGLSSNSLAALDWIVTERPDVDVVNMSLGTEVLFRGFCDNRGFGTLYSVPVNALAARGVLVAAASGNDGSRKKMSMPACLRGTVAVGAGFDTDYAAITGPCEQVAPGPGDVACFSNRPKQLDLVAPGAFITSAALRRGAATQAGTSMASPHVAGCAALLASGFTGVSGDEIAAAMVDSGAPVVDNRGRRFPRLDCEAAADLLGARP
jgi:subtilisin family serine protease